MLRVVHGKVVATKASARIDRDPRAWFDKSARALLSAGALSSQRDPDAWLKWPEVDALLDGLVLPMLTTAYATQRPVPLDDIVEVITTTVLEAFEFPKLTDEQVGRSVSFDVTYIFDALELAGVVLRAGVQEPEDMWSHLRTGGTVELTDAGVLLIRDLFVETGHDAPTAGTFADRPASELLQAARDMDPPTLWGELEAWRRRRTDDEAARSLAEAIPELDVAARFLAFGRLAHPGSDRQEPHREVRRQSGPEGGASTSHLGSQPLTTIGQGAGARHVCRVLSTSSRTRTRAADRSRPDIRYSS